MPQFTIQDVRVETVQKSPKNRYEVATVVYTTNRGEQKEKKVMSFANPGVFNLIKGLTPPTEVMVTYVEGDQYYNWAKVELVTNDPKEVKPTTTPAAGGKVLGNQYETREERHTRQLHIVRQSSLSNAIAMLTPGAKTALKVEEVIDLAQQLVDFVYESNEDDLEAITSDTAQVPGE